MLASVFTGNGATLKMFQTQFLPMERLDWSRLANRNVFSNTTRHDARTPAISQAQPRRSSFAAVHATKPVYRRLGDHPALHQLTRGITTREMIKAILVLLFPSSYSDVGCNVVLTSDVAHPPSPRQTAAPGSAHRRRRLAEKKSSSNSKTATSSSTRGEDKVALDDMIPLDEVGGVLDLEPSQFLCHVFLPPAYTVHHPNGDDDESWATLPADAALHVMRAARSLCAWTRWAMSQKNVAVNTAQQLERYYVHHVVDTVSLNTPIMFSAATRTKALRFMDLRDIGPQSITSFVHMLSVFLTDVFELAFSESSLFALKEAVSSSDPVEFIKTLDRWRFGDGVHMLKKLLAAYDTLEALGQAPLTMIVAVSKLILPTESHRELLERNLAALPRRTYGAVAYTLLHAQVPLGSVADAHRSVRQHTALQHVGESKSRQLAKYALPPGWLEANCSDAALAALTHGGGSSDAEVGPGGKSLAPSRPRGNATAVDVFSRVSSSSILGGDASKVTLESVLLERSMNNPADESVANVLYQAAVVRDAVRRSAEEEWVNARRSVRDLRPHTAAAFGKTALSSFGPSEVQRAQDSTAHWFDRHRRAVERAKRRVTTSGPRLEVVVPRAPAHAQSILDDDVWEERQRLVKAHSGLQGSDGKNANHLGSLQNLHDLMVFDTERELQTQIPHLKHLSRKDVFELFTAKTEPQVKPFD